ncbi:hypothetical protein HHK36_004383 [Tetracentron sinense]|uniref:Uncharacterized protein n=1 Tax=Tetracentron sinense TaxID=13715 RepID=A0A834ZPX3_TETSI|nr:hypothetical protein HHK36_004383 [Tetracentron sinense]
MERSKPTLAPEWLKSTGNLTGGGSATHHFASSSLHADDHAVTLPTRNRLSVSTSDSDTPRSALLDRTSSSYFRRSSSNNGSMMHDKDPSPSYSSFSRSHRDRDREKDPRNYREKEKSVLGDYRDHDHSDPPIFNSRVENYTLRRSHSMISGKRSEVWPRRAAADSNSGKNGNHNNGNGLLVGGSIVSGIHKAAFEREFPSLGAEERQGAPDIGRVPSPGLSTAVQSLPIGTSTVIGGDGWTSALAEVPMIIGINSMGLSSVQQTAPVSSIPGAPTTMTGLNMAETLAQAPSRAHTAPQLSVETQRLEELAIKKSRQLIPMTPSMPKPSVLNPSDKPKPKTTAKIGEMSMATKIGQQQLSSSHVLNHTAHGGPVRLNPPNTSHVGKLHVLKPARENGVSPTAKDGSSPTNASRISNSPLAVATTAAVAPLRTPNNPKLATAERKAAVLAATLGSSADKRPTISQAQSRNAFFDLVRKKNSANLSSAVSDLSPLVSSPILVKSGALIAEVATATLSPQGSEASSSDPSGVDCPAVNRGDMTSNGDACEVSQRFPNNGEKQFSFDALPVEKEVAFLHLLGWDENSLEEVLTEEEINAFYQEVILSNCSFTHLEYACLLCAAPRIESVAVPMNAVESFDVEPCFLWIDLV